MALLVSLDNMKNLLGIALGNTDDDAYLTNELTSMSAIVEKYCARVFTLGSYVEEVDYYDGDTVIVNSYPITTLTSVTLDGDILDLTGSPVKVIRADGSLELKEGSFCNYSNVEIAYEGGFDPIPYDIQRVVSDLVHSRYANKFINDPTRRIRSEGIPDVANYIYERTKAFEDNPLLGPYMHILDVYISSRALI